MTRLRRHAVKIKTLSPDELRKRLLSEYKRCYLRGGWKEVSKKYGVAPGTLCSIAKGNYLPKDPEICRKLNLRVTAPAPVCMVCGEVHTTKRCTKVKRQARDLFALPVKTLAKMIEERS